MIWCFYVFLALIVLINDHEVAAKPSLKIINGTTADDGEFPYMVQLRDIRGRFMCGGSIIAPIWILTAGHCVPDWLIHLIVYGTNQLYDGSSNPNTSITVEEWFQHPNFTHVIIDGQSVPIYDVGILKLSAPIQFSKTAQPISLAEANSDIPVHLQGVLSGWGDNDTRSDLPSFLQKINLPRLSDDECTQKIDNYGKIKIFNATHDICTDDHNDGGCYGDSGSPYVINGTQYGILSWSLKPCYGVVPNTYSRITNPEYRNWIKSITNV